MAGIIEGLINWFWPTAETYTYPGNRFTASHHAVDIETTEGSAVWSPADGKVTFAGWDNAANGGYGLYEIITTPDGYRIILGHLSKLFVNVGDTVTGGQEVGLSGNTGNSSGPHLHFEIQTSEGYGHWVNPLDAITQYLTNFLTPGPEAGYAPTAGAAAPGAAAGTPGASPSADTGGAVGGIVKDIISGLKSALNIKDAWLKPINLVAIFAGVIFVTLGVAGLVFEVVGKTAGSAVGEAIGGAIKTGGGE
jgi:hypothetical protein